MKTHHRILKRSLIGFGILMILMLILSFFLMHGWNQFAEAYKLQYESYEYDYPASLSIKQLQLEYENYKVFVNELDIKWVWRPLLKGNIQIEQLAVRQAEISQFQNKNTTSAAQYNVQVEDTENSSDISIVLKQVHLEDISYSMRTKEDSLLLNLPALRLNHLQVNNSILLDSLLIHKGTVHYTNLATSFNSSDTSPLTFQSFPEFRVNHIALDDNTLRYSQDDQTHKLSKFDLKLNGWKNTDLLDFKVEKLAFTYQDTLDLALVLEEGEVADNLNSRLQNIDINLPGISLNIADLLLDQENDLQGNISLGPSSISMGALKCFTPIILVAMDLLIPDDSLVQFEGSLSFDQDHLSFDSLPFRLMRATKSNLTGLVDWSEDSITFDLKFDDIHTERSDLYAFLIEEDYNEFFLWPSDVNGSGSLRGNLNYFDIQGALNTNQGHLAVKSIVTFDQADNMFYSIALQSDSMLVSEVVDYLPMDVPYGQLDLTIAGTLNEDGSQDTLRMDVKSSGLMAEGRLVNGLDLIYYFNNEYDSIWLYLEDEHLQADFSGAYYGGDTSSVTFGGKIQHLSAALLNPALTRLSASTDYSGSYDWFGDDFYKITLRSDSTYISTTNSNTVLLPNSMLVYQEDADTLMLNFSANEKHVFKLASNNSLFNISTDSTNWLDHLPDTEAFISFNVDSTLTIPLSGYPITMAIDTLHFLKTDEAWLVQLQAPELSYEDIHIRQLNLALAADSLSQQGKLLINEIDNPYLALDSLWVDISYLQNLYQLNANTHISNLDKDINFGLELLTSDEQYVLRMNEKQDLLISDKAWQIQENQGLTFDSAFSLQLGGLTLKHQNTNLSFATLEDGNFKFKVDSLALDDLTRAFDTSLMVNGNLNAELLYHPQTAFMSWKADINALRTEGIDVGMLSLEGYGIGDTLETSLQLVNEDALAKLDLNSQGKGLNYAASVNNLDIGFLESFHVWPDNMNLSGIISAELSGNIDSTLQSDGFIAFAQSDLLLADISTSVHISSDTLYLHNDQLEFRDFNIYDYQKNPLTLSGSLILYPNMFADIQIKSESFTALNDLNNNAYLRGNLDVMSDLSITGGSDNLTVFGLLKVLPGAFVRYSYQGDINLIDASQTISFVDFDQLDQNKESIKTRPVSKPINWNVNLEIVNSTFEVVLSEVTQEFVRVNTDGQIRLRGGASNLPMVYGSLTSSSGRALIFPPVIPDLDLNVENVSVQWSGEADKPEIAFKGTENIKASPKGLSTSFSERNELVDFQVLVVLDKTNVENLAPRFEVQSTDGEVNNYLQSLGAEQREKYAIDLLVFGSIGSESVAGASQTLAPVVSKLNEIANRNLKDTDLSFGVVNYDNGTEGNTSSTQTNINYKVSRGLFKNKMFFSIGGDVGVINNTAAYGNNMPTAHLIGNVEIGYRLREKPAISLIGSRRHVYEGVIDGDVIRSSIGLNFKKTYPNLESIFRREKVEEKEQ